MHRAAAVDLRARGRRDSRGVTLLVGANRDLGEWARERYGIGPQPALQRDGDREVRLDVSAVFLDPVAREAAAGIRRLGWPFSRLACLASSVAYVRSAKAPEREADVSAISSRGLQLILPVEAHADALASDAPELAPGPHHDLGADFYQAHRNQQRYQRNLIRQLEQLTGQTVTLTPRPERPAA